MEKKMFYFVFALLSACFASCDNNNDDEKPAMVAIEGAEANTLVDLTPYQDGGWRLYLGSQEYGYSGSDNGLTAWMPIADPCYFPSNEGSTNAISLRLYAPVHPQRPILISKSVESAHYNVDDQSTATKLFSADVLSGVYVGSAMKQLKDITFTHANALWDFEVINQPEGTTVAVIESVLLAPYRTTATGSSYKAIVIGGILPKKGILIYKNDPYDVANNIGLYTQDMHESDTYYKFTVRVNDDKSAVIENVQKSRWSDMPTWRRNN